MDKKELRASIRARKRAMTEEEIVSRSEKLTELFLLGIPGQIAIFLWFRMFRPTKNTKKEKQNG